MHFCISLIAASAMISVASAALFNVTVAPDHHLTYDPPFLTGVKNGDIIGFKFVSGTHTVTQSTFDQPCTKKANGYDSGIIPSAGSPSWTLTVDDASAPLWFNCVPHCKLGMVFAINPTADNTFDAFTAAAKGQTQPSSSNTASTTPSTMSSGTASVTSTTPGATISSGTASVSTTTGGTATSTSPATTSTTVTPTGNAGGALGQVSTNKVALWLSTLGVVVCMML